MTKYKEIIRLTGLGFSQHKIMAANSNKKGHMLRTNGALSPV